ncbi:CBO0543 family protein [Bacillus sp. Marseille-Q1617]|uniref:CBO0543 family protein n=1 Tax=Bacillus sp. Marseille-Q1617 TaxID=2736887 RepID=UPI00158ADE8B|nr:CBO0543 family protein [Bacillus sp. Marseille-Q1617]
MFGLIIAVILFNFVAFKTNKTLTAKQIAHVFAFTIALQISFDLYVDMKYQGYWYFTKEVDWASLPAHSILLPPVNMMFINWYPFDGSRWRRIRFIVCWTIALLLYEVIALLPEPWGYFHNGWWTLGHSAVLDPILLFILIVYYKNFIKEE